jgi:hypothetical protein
MRAEVFSWPGRLNTHPFITHTRRRQTAAMRAVPIEMVNDRPRRCAPYDEMRERAQVDSYIPTCSGRL